MKSTCYTYLLIADLCTALLLAVQELVYGVMEDPDVEVDGRPATVCRFAVNGNVRMPVAAPRPAVGSGDELVV